MILLPFYGEGFPDQCVQGKTSFKIQFPINPLVIFNKYPDFILSEYYNRFCFVSENGTEYVINCVKVPTPTETDSLKMTPIGWNVWVDLKDSLDPERDMEHLINWLDEKFSPYIFL
jgi:hypothetical protein